MVNLKSSYEDNFQVTARRLQPLKILNDIVSTNLEELFPDVVVALKLFLVLPVSVATGERSFSMLSFIKNDRRSCMGQQRLNNLATLNMNFDVARSMDFSPVINHYAKLRALTDPNFF